MSDQAKNPVDWQRVMVLFEQAMDVEASRREAFLADHCSDESPEVLQELRQLLDENNLEAPELAQPGVLAELAEQFVDDDTSNLAQTQDIGAQTSSQNRDASQQSDSNRASFTSSEVPNDSPREPIPERIGRYEIIQVLGEGGYGRVYLAFDPATTRKVAIKAPSRKLFEGGVSVASFLDEARAAGQLNHPGLVTVYDVQTEDHQPFIVQEYIEGVDVANWSRSQKPTPKAIVLVMKRVAEAIGFAHQHSLYHRDLKPANILIDLEGIPHVVDFGLAIHANRLWERRGERAGTPPYMSPEQVRGETHRIDGRTDIWSLGVIFYELLTGAQPFRGVTATQLFEEIKRKDPKPPRQYDPAITTEQERIALKCLEKRAADRYSSAAELIDDLDECLLRLDSTMLLVDATKTPLAQDTHRQHPDTDTPVNTLVDEPQRVIPKGLRSYDHHDAAFFLRLLPGPYDRHGLPEGIRFWQARIEERQMQYTFPVGLIFGPTGCGKSSLVKAGLLPRLNERIASVYIEVAALGSNLEDHLLRRLHAQFPALKNDFTLGEAMIALREQVLRSSGKKLLIVLDQFEQWLDHNSCREGSELSTALRQCDGVNVQCLVVVRDDFWMAATRFMNELEINLLENENARGVDLFSPKHARFVLTAFGQSYGDVDDTPTVDQMQFIEAAVENLVVDGQINCVRLALFAQMMHGRPWSAECEFDIDEVGVAFLERTWSASHASPECRYHEPAARRVLAGMLPKLGTLKGDRLSYAELRLVSGYGHRKEDLESLIQLLDRKLKLITSVAANGVEENGVGEELVDKEPSTQTHRYFQLTHDYLVPSLKDWLSRKQRETRRGRAELMLDSFSQLWNRTPQAKFLPGLVDASRIILFSNRRNWTNAQSKMMRAATIRHGVLLLGFFLVLIVSTSCAIQLRSSHMREKQAKAQALSSLQQARNSIDAWLSGPFEDLKELPGTDESLIQILELAAKEYEHLASNQQDDAELQLARAMVHQRKGQLYELLEKWSEAEAAFGASSSLIFKSLKHSPTDERALLEAAISEMKMGHALLRQGEPEDAAGRLESAQSFLDQRPKSRRNDDRHRYTQGSVVYYQCLLLSQPERREEKMRRALNEFYAAYKAAPQSTEYLTGGVAARQMLAQWLLAHGRWDDAKELYRSAVAEFESLLETGDQALLAYELRGDSFQNLASLHRNDFDLQAECLAHRSALRDYRQLENANPGRRHYRRRTAIAQLNLGDALRRQGETVEAKENLMAACMSLEETLASGGHTVRDRELYASSLDRLAQFHIQLRQPNEAFKFLTEAIRHFALLVESRPAEVYQERRAFAYAHLGQVLHQQNNRRQADVYFSEAVNDLNDLAAKHPDMRRLDEGLAMVYIDWSEILDETESRQACQLAFENWEAVVADQATPRNVAHFTWCLLSCRDATLRDGNRAFELASQLAKRDPSNPEFISLLGAASFEIGNTENAVILLERLDEKRSLGICRGRFYLAKALQDEGKTEQARRIYDDAVNELNHFWPGSLPLHRLRDDVSRQLMLTPIDSE